jgi:hypothetical protein
LQSCRPSLAPVGYTNRFRGITGYLFRSEDLRIYRPVPDVKAHPEVFLNFREAAFVLGIKSNIVRGLVAQGLLGVAAGYQNGFAKLVPEKEVQHFADSYKSTSMPAKRFRLNSGSLVRHLKESGTPLLAIPNPDAGRGHAFFFCARMLQPRYGFRAADCCGTSHSAASKLPGRRSGGLQAGQGNGFG